MPHVVSSGQCLRSISRARLGAGAAEEQVRACAVQLGKNDDGTAKRAS